MMSERRRKQTWCLNPRGKHWSEDSNKFGQKLLEKMGWKSGKGLGANEDGMIDHIRVAYKNDTQGMGFKDTDDQWTEHQSNFSKLLNTLGGSQNSKEVEDKKEPVIESLEKKSQSSKARVHYHKFTRGKDLSRYSEKDLANIFGKKSLTELSRHDEVNKEKGPEKENFETKSFGVVTHNGGNMLEYFKTKLPQFKNDLKTLKNYSSDTKNESESDVERPSFGLGFGADVDKNQENPKYQSESFDTKEKKKKKVDETDNFRKPCFGLGYDRYSENENKPKSKFTSFVKATDTGEKKKPLEFGVSIGLSSEKDKKHGENNNTDNTVANLSQNGSLTNGFGFNTSNISKIHSSFKAFIKGSDQTNNPTGNNQIENKCVKKKHKKNTNYDSGHEKDQDATNNLEDGKKKKTKKGKMIVSDVSNVEAQSSVLGFGKKKEDNIKPTFVSFITEMDNADEEDQTNNRKKNKIKSKKEKKLDEVVDINTTEGDYIQNENITKIGKKKKRKHMLSIENPGFNSDDSVINSEVNPKRVKLCESEISSMEVPSSDLGFERKKKGKKNKKGKLKKECNLEESVGINIIEEAHIQNANFTKNNKKNKRKHLLSIENPGFNFDDSIITAEVQSSDLGFGSKKKHKKNKRDKSRQERILDEAVDININEEDCTQNENITKIDKKNKRKHMLSIENPGFNSDDSVITSEVNPKGVKSSVENLSKNDKKKKRKLLSIENPGFDSNESPINIEANSNKYEVKRRKKDKILGIVNPGLDLMSPPPTDDVKNQSVIDELPIMDENLMLNIVCTPIIKKDNDRKPQRRKSVRFSEVNQSIFINKLDSPADLKRNGDAGLDNAAYDPLGNRIEENIDTLNKQLDDYQAEVENDINEAKMQVIIGEVGDPNGENEPLPSGEVKLKFKYANFGRMPPWMDKNKALSNPKSSYRHLIKGDIVLGFKNTNIHDIKGYNEHLKETS